MKTILGLVLLISTQAAASRFIGMLDLNTLRSEFMNENQRINAVREEQGRAEGYLCEGNHYFKLLFQAVLKDIQFDLQDGFIDVKLDLNELYARAEGRYRSEFSACLAVRGWVGLGSDWAHVESRLFLDEQPDGKPKVRLEVRKTELGTLHFGSGVARWAENAVTGIVGRVLSHLWDTKLGDWIERKISEQIEKKLADERNENS